MPRALRILIVLLQLIVGLLLGFNVAYRLGFGRNRELLVIGAGAALGIWGTGALVAWMRDSAPSLWSLAATLAGSLLGVLLIVITPPFGFAALLLPLFGALLGYYLVDGWSSRQ